MKLFTTEDLFNLDKELRTLYDRFTFRALMTLAESRGYTHALHKGEPYDVSAWLDQVGRDSLPADA